MPNPTISTGFTDLDEITSGLRRGDLIVLAGRPSNGKTILALDIARHVAQEEGQPVAIFSFEMPKERLLKFLDLADCPFHISDEPGQNAAQMRSFARQIEESRGALGLIVVDYLQLVRASHPHSSVTVELKNMAREFDCPVIALSQLPETVDERDDKRPVLADWEQMGLPGADTVALTYRPLFYEEGFPSSEIAEVIIGQPPVGLLGSVALGFERESKRFVNLPG